MTSIIRPAGLGPWRIAAIGAVGALAVGMGVAAGSFLLSNRASALGAGAAYVPASAPFYVELRVEPSAAQDAALREMLARFGPIEGIDTSQPLHDQLVEYLDTALAGEGSSLSWTNDVAPWFDGHLALAVTDLPLDVMGVMGDMGATPPAVVLLGVTDAAAAEAAVGRIMGEAGGPEFTESDHAGVTVHVASGAMPVSFAITADQLIFGSEQGAVVAALDAHANPSSSLGGKEGMAELAGAVPSDWLAFATYDMTEMMAQAFDQGAEADPAMADAFRSMLEHQSLRGAIAVSAGGDRILLDSASDVPTGPFAVENADRGLADEVPAGALYYSEGGSLGATLAGVIEPLKAALGTMPDVAEQIETAESALGAELTELVSWIDDAAIAAGLDGDTPWAGTVLVPTDMASAERRLSQLATFASLGALDPSSGVTVSDEEVDGVTVTTLRWADAGVDEIAGAPVTDVVIEWAITEDRVLIGFGDAFVRRGLALSEADSLAAQARYGEAVAEMGGSSNAGVTWIDLAGVRDAIGGMLGAIMPMAPGDDGLDFLGPIDRFVSVSRVEGDVLVQHAALLME